MSDRSSNIKLLNTDNLEVNPATEEKQDQAIALIGNYAVVLDDVSTSSMTYIGKATPGTSTSSALWQIKRMDESGTPTTLTITYADGNANFDNVWDNRTNLTYS